MATKWLRQLANRIRGNKRRTKRKSPVRSRLALEPLERRMLLATQVFNVTTTADEISANGLTSLREAILQANAVPAADDAVINLTTTRYEIGDDRDRLQPLLSPIDTEFSVRDGEFGDFDIRRALTINGNGAIIAANGHGRVFDIRVSSGTVTLNDLTAQTGNGHTQGGGIFAQGGLTLELSNVSIFTNQTAAAADAQGAGLYANFSGSGGLVMTDGEVLANTAQSTPGDSARGGGVYVQGGQVTIDGTEFRLNTATGQDAANSGETGGFAFGGGLYARDVNRLQISNASFQTNTVNAGRGGEAGSADRGRGGDAYGGAIYFAGFRGEVEIHGTTFDSNRAYAGLGGPGVANSLNSNDRGGDGGNGYGGAVVIHPVGLLGLPTSVTATIDTSRFSNNLVRAGHGGNGQGFVRGFGGEGGDARGGGVVFGIEAPFTDNTRLTVTDSTFESNSAIGGIGGEASRTGAGGAGGSAFGGGVFAGIGVQTFTDSPFLGNKAVAGNGGQFQVGTGGGGGRAYGGAIASDGTQDLTISGHIAITGDITDPTEFIAGGPMLRNLAVGGSGGTKRLVAEASDDDLTGRGGDALGGAVAVIDTGRTLRSTEILYDGNLAMAGDGGNGVPIQPAMPGAQGGGSGTARGGAIYTPVDTHLTRNTFMGNIAAGARFDLLDPDTGTLAGVAPITGGPGGRDPDGNGHGGGSGGLALGGAVFAELGNLSVSDSGFTNNQATGGMGGFGAAGTSFDEQNGGDGGDGGQGGSAYGGAIRVETSQTAAITRSTFVTNFASGGRGGSGGMGGAAGRKSNGEVMGGLGGDGGNGGAAHGAAISFEGDYNPFDSNPTVGTVQMTELLVVGNQAIAGEGGFAGKGGAGAQLGNSGGRGGQGGAAHGGGVEIARAVAVIDLSTLEANRAAAGDGAAGGYGGGANEFGGAGGNGGAGGAARGGGLAFHGLAVSTFQNAGSLTMSRSTVVGNEALGGTGGHGGFGGPGVLGGLDGGHGGSGGDAHGGGINAVYLPGGSATLTNVTLARNYVEAGDGGFGSLGGQITNTDGTPVENLPFRYDAETAGSVEYGAPRALAGSNTNSGPGTIVFSPTLEYDNTATNLGDGGLGVDSISVGLPDLSAPYAAITVYAASLVTTTSTAAAIGIIAGLHFVAGVPAYATLAGQAPAPLVGATGLTLGAGGLTLFGALSAGGAVASIGVVLIANVIIDGALTGDWEGAVERTLGTPGETYAYDFLILLRGVKQDEYDENDPGIPSVGQTGDDGAAGTAGGAGLFGPLTLARTAAADNTAARRDLRRGASGDRYLVSEHYVTLAAADVAGGAVEAGGANQTNFIGAIDSGFANSIHGTTASPLEAKFDTQTRHHGGTMPTLKLLPGSPARGVIQGFSGTSQNNYAWSGTADIGAWGGPANRAPNTLHGPLQMQEDGSLTAAIGADPDNDPLALVGPAPVPANGSIQFHADGTFTYTPRADWFGREQLSYQVTDGALTRTVTTTIDVLPVNDAPVLADVTQLDGLEDTPFELDLLTLVTDIDTPPELLQFRVFARGPGSATLLPDGHTVRFTPPANYHFFSGLQYFVTDPGNGAGPAYVNLTNQTILLHFLPANDAPVNILPASPQVDEDSQVIITGVRVTDVDSTTATPVTAQVTLSVEHGTLSLAQTTGLSFTAGDGSDDTTMTIRGQLAAIDAALASLTYRPELNFNGVDHLHIHSDDLGNFGVGGPLTDDDLLDILVNAVNDAPTLSVPGAQTGYEDVRLTLTGLSVADVDLTPTTGMVEVTLGVASGTLRLGQTAGLTFAAGGNNAASMTIRGTLSAVNAALAGLSYLSNLNYSGSDLLTMMVNDLGNVGSGGPLSAQSTVALTVQSSAQQAANLGQQVTALRTQGVLSASQANGLLAKLNLKGNNGDAGKVGAFINNVNSLLNDGVLTQSEADILLAAANILLQSVTNLGR